MVDKSELLGDLQIDRDAPKKSNRPIYLFLVIAVAAGLLFGAYSWWSFPSDPVVHTALAVGASTTIKSDSVLDATGYVVARTQATVSSKVPGKVTEIFVEEGMYVEADQLVATLDDSISAAQLALSLAQLEAVKTSVRELETQLKKARLDLARVAELEGRNLESASTLDQHQLTVEQLEIGLERARNEIAVSEKTVQLQEQYLDDLNIRAPFAGVVVAKAAQPGEMIAPVAGGGFTRTGICTIVDMNSLEVQIDVNEKFINRVVPGQQVTVQLTAYPDVKMPAEVIAIIPTADRARATVRVRVRFLQRDERVLPDMAVKVSFLQEGEEAELIEVPQGVFVPDSAIDSRGSPNVVWVVKENNVSSRQVTLGKRENGRVQILDGVRPGERVVSALDSDLLQKLVDGSTVEIAN